MAAVTGNMGEGGPLISASGERLGFAGLGGDAREEPRTPAAMHRSLTRSHWIRSVLTQYLQSVKVQHFFDGNRLKLRIAASNDIDEKGNAFIPRHVVPWSQTKGRLYWVEVFSYENSKMDCPSFDLPTGAAEVGGTCPGAREGQSIVPGRKGVLQDGTPVNLPKAICMACYGEEVPIAYTNNVLRQMLVQMWTVGMVNQHFDGFVEVMTKALTSIPRSQFARKSRLPAPGQILPVRLHTVGDFFSPQYAAAWIEICNRVYETGSDGHLFRFWAPTRTQAAWPPALWPQLLSKLRHKNLLVRGSAFHFDDPAPAPLAPGNSKGSTSLFVTDAGREAQRTNFKAQGSEEKFFDWRCPVYTALESEKKTCSQSVNPDGKGTSHCRACWTRPDLSIDYPAH